MPTLNEYAAFANIAGYLRDGTNGLPGAPIVPPGWVLIASDNNQNQSGSGGHYYGYAFRNQQTGEVIIASAGLQQSSTRDLLQVGAIANGTLPQAEIDEARYFVQGVIDNQLGGVTSNLYFTGASEGGSSPRSCPLGIKASPASPSARRARRSANMQANRPMSSISSIRWIGSELSVSTSAQLFRSELRSLSSMGPLGRCLSRATANATHMRWRRSKDSTSKNTTICPTPISRPWG